MKTIKIFTVLMLFASVGICEDVDTTINLGRLSIARVTACGVNGKRKLDNEYYGILNAFDDNKGNTIEGYNYTSWLGEIQPPAPYWVNIRFIQPVTLDKIIIDFDENEFNYDFVSYAFEIEYFGNKKVTTVNDLPLKINDCKYKFIKPVREVQTLRLFFFKKKPISNLEINEIIILGKTAKPYSIGYPLIDSIVTQKEILETDKIIDSCKVDSTIFSIYFDSLYNWNKKYQLIEFKKDGEVINKIILKKHGRDQNKIKDNLYQYTEYRQKVIPIQDGRYYLIEKRCWEFKCDPKIQRKYDYSSEGANDGFFKLIFLNNKGDTLNKEAIIDSFGNYKISRTAKYLYSNSVFYTIPPSDKEIKIPSSINCETIFSVDDKYALVIEEMKPWLEGGYTINLFLINIDSNKVLTKTIGSNKFTPSMNWTDWEIDTDNKRITHVMGDQIKIVSFSEFNAIEP